MPTMKRNKTTTIALSAILIPTVCFGWGRDGHRITGFIAAKYLTSQAAAAVKDLLGDESLADAATWADQNRRERNACEAIERHVLEDEPVR